MNIGTFKMCVSLLCCRVVVICRRAQAIAATAAAAAGAASAGEAGLCDEMTVITIDYIHDDGRQ